LVYGITLALYSIPLRQGLLGYGYQTTRGFIYSAAKALQLPKLIGAPCWMNFAQTCRGGRGLMRNGWRLRFFRFSCFFWFRHYGFWEFSFMSWTDDLSARLKDGAKLAFAHELRQASAGRGFRWQVGQIDFDVLGQFSGEDLKVLGKILPVLDDEFRKRWLRGNCN